MAAAHSHSIQNHAAFTWSVADLLRGNYKQSEYGKVILPLTVLRRHVERMLTEPRVAWEHEAYGPALQVRNRRPSMNGKRAERAFDQVDQ